MKGCNCEVCAAFGELLASIRAAREVVASANAVLDEVNERLAKQRKERHEQAL